MRRSRTFMHMKIGHVALEIVQHYASCTVGNHGQVREGVADQPDLGTRGSAEQLSINRGGYS